MAERMDILITQMMIFSTLLLIGYFGQKLRLISRQMTDDLSKLLVNIVLPAMVMTVTVSGGSRENLFDMAPFLFCAFLSVGTMIFIGWLSGTLLRMKSPTKGVHMAVVGFTNNGFIGFPLLLAIYPQTAPLAIATFAIADTSTLWTIGQKLTDPSKGKTDLKKMINPVNIAFLIGMSMLLLEIRPQNVVWDTFTNVGGMSKYLALIYIGAEIGSKGLKKLFQRPSIFLLIPIKLILGPLCVFLLLKTIGIISMEYIIMLTTFAMLPSMVVICILAKNNGSDEDYASGGLLVTTIASLVTMPFMMWVISYL